MSDDESTTSTSRRLVTDSEADGRSTIFSKHREQTQQIIEHQKIETRPLGNMSSSPSAPYISPLVQVQPPTPDVAPFIQPCFPSAAQEIALPVGVYPVLTPSTSNDNLPRTNYENNMLNYLSGSITKPIKFDQEPNRKISYYQYLHKFHSAAPVHNTIRIEPDLSGFRDNSIIKLADKTESTDENDPLLRGVKRCKTCKKRFTSRRRTSSGKIFTIIMIILLSIYFIRPWGVFSFILLLLIPFFVRRPMCKKCQSKCL